MGLFLNRLLKVQEIHSLFDEGWLLECNLDQGTESILGLVLKLARSFALLDMKKGGGTLFVLNETYYCSRDLTDIEQRVSQTWTK